MNVLFLSLDTSPNNKVHKITSSFIRKDMEHLHKKGHKIYYLSDVLENDVIENEVNYISKDKLLEKNSFLRRVKNLFFALRHLGFFGFMIIKRMRSTLYICGVERACIKAVKKFGIDIIHTNFLTPNGESAVLSSMDCNVPVVATLRGAELRAMKEFDYGALLDQFFECMLRKSVKYIHCITAPNKFLCEKLRSDFKVPEEKIRWVPNGVERMSIEKNQSDPNADIIFISVANLIKLKNLDVVLLSAKELSNEFNFRIVIVGDGILRGKYEEMIRELLIKNVTILNQMLKPELFKLMAKCDCLIHPSFSEGMPNVVLESLAIGVPCIVSDIPAHRDVIKEGVNGFFFDPYDKESLKSRMRRILLNRNILAGMERNCVKTVEKFSIEKRVDRFIEIYNEVKRFKELAGRS